MRERGEIGKTARTEYPQLSTSFRVAGSYRLIFTQSLTAVKLLDWGDGPAVCVRTRSLVLSKAPG